MFFIKWQNEQRRRITFFWPQQQPGGAGIPLHGFTKTQYAGWQIHILIVRLMEHIFKKYLFDVKVMDEGDYWDTHDEALLKKNFKLNGVLISSFVTAVESFPLQDGETMEVYFLRMMEWVNTKLK